MSVPRVSTQQRFTRRQRARRWGWLRQLLAVLAAAALVGAAVWLVFFSSVLAVEAVDVDGVRQLSRGEVAAAAAVPVGQPLARVGLDGVEQRVEQTLAEVADAEATRTWPDTVTIAVRERTPVAVVARDDGPWLIDAEGVEFRQVHRLPARLPVVRPGVSGATWAGAEPVAEAAVVLAGLPRGLARRVDEVDAATVDSITLRLAGGRTVVWGSAADASRKADVLQALLANRRLDGDVYDVSVPGAPTVAGE
ncbi:MAG: FtsQ-type POTRA domain-containing protein [Actinomycetota bacterium]|nr:FtsQ-type POTRA domain-containing protein [Actinomycetota bacterium]